MRPTFVDHRNAPVRVVVIDDSELVRHGIKAVLSLYVHRPVEVVGEAGTVAQALEVCREQRPDVILLDVRLPDGNGFEACPQLLEVTPTSRVLVLTGFTVEADLYRAIASGAHGCLLKEINPAELVDAICDVRAGGAVLQNFTGGSAESFTTPMAAAPSCLDCLSEQQIKVLEYVAAGKTNIEIARALQLSPFTVRNYLVTIFAKLGVHRRSHATALYVQSRPSRSAAPFEPELSQPLAG